MEKFVELSYSRHIEIFDDCGEGKDLRDIAITWLQKDTTDYWRHERMYNILDPILCKDNKSRWLTVGDGRFGSDAHYIIEHGCYALATDLTETLLKEAVDLGYITECKKENAESLSFNDNSFDYVFCKEAYHHFPRPYIALYEMLRVAKKAIVLIEPNDIYYYQGTIKSLLRITKNIMKRIIKGSKNTSTINGSYEEDAANYIYPISRHELENIALGLNYRLIVYKGINDYYIKGVEYEKIIGNCDGIIQKKIKKMIKKADRKCKYFLEDYNMLGAIIFKEKPSDELISKLVELKYEIKYISENPYIKN